MGEYPIGEGGYSPPQLSLHQDSAARYGRKSPKENSDMRNAMAYAFVVIAIAPLVGIWRGHMWAKANGFVLRKPTPAEHSSQTA